MAMETLPKELASWERPEPLEAPEGSQQQQQQQNNNIASYIYIYIYNFKIIYITVQKQNSDVCSTFFFSLSRAVLAMWWSCPTA